MSMLINRPGTAEGLVNESGSAFVYIAISCFTTALLISVIFNRWANISTARSGAMAGAVIAALVGIVADTMVMGQYNLLDPIVLIINIFGNLAWGAIGGAAIGWLLGR